MEIVLNELYIITLLFIVLAINPKLLIGTLSFQDALLTNRNVIFRLKLGGYEDDVFSLPEVDQEENSIDLDEFYDRIDKEVKEYCRSMKKVSCKKTIENGFKWMSEECFLAFTNSAENLHFEVCQHSLFIFILM